MRRHAFTLVEIMIVVAIIGLLASIAIPSFTKARNLSQQSACLHNLRMIDSAKEEWAMAARKTDGDPVTLASVNEYIKGNSTPVCPGGGTYSYNNIGSDPVCVGVTVTSHAVPR